MAQKKSSLAVPIPFSPNKSGSLGSECESSLSNEWPMHLTAVNANYPESTIVGYRDQLRRLIRTRTNNSEQKTEKWTANPCCRGLLRLFLLSFLDRDRRIGRQATALLLTQAMTDAWTTRTHAVEPGPQVSCGRGDPHMDGTGVSVAHDAGVCHWID